MEQGTPEINEAQQYTGAEVRKLLSADGRKQKDRADTAEANLKNLTNNHETLTTQFNALSGQVKTLLQEKDDAEATTVQDDPVALTSLRARQANRAEKIRLDGFEASVKAREGKLGERETTLNQKETSIDIKLAAMAAGVDEKTLADLVPDGNAGRLANAAKLLKQSGIQEIDPATGKPKPTGLTQKPASVISAGGETKTTAERMLEKAKGK